METGQQGRGYFVKDTIITELPKCLWLIKHVDYGRFAFPLIYFTIKDYGDLLGVFLAR